MAGLLHHEIDDFVTTTLPLYKKRKWTDLSTEFVEYVSSRVMTEKNISERGGSKVNFKVQTKHSENAKNSGMYGVDSTNVEDVMISCEVEWSMQTTNFSYDIYEEFFQSDPETIIDELMVREHDAYTSLAELNESNMWGAPTSTSNKERAPYGIPFWIQKNNSVEVDGGLNGGNPAGFSGGAAGVDSSQYTRWRNWTFAYKRVTADDLVKKTKKAIEFTHFVAPHPHSELGFGAKQCEIFTTYRVVSQLETLAESRNDNLGKDVARYMGQVTIGGIPITWVHWLENNDSTDPLYGVNWKHLRPFVKKNCFMRKNKPKEAAKQHTVREVHIDSWMQWICTDRRRLFCGVLQA